jgi:hypothetical protein
MFAVTVTDKELGGTAVYGPYRTLAKAQRIAERMTDWQSANWYDPEKYDVVAAKLNRWE